MAKLSRNFHEDLVQLSKSALVEAFEKSERLVDVTVRVVEQLC